MKLDEYTMHARIYPGVICAIPVFLLVAAFKNEAVTQIILDIVAVEVLGKVSVGLALFFLLMQASRFIGKDLFELKLFVDELHFPTTDYLLASNTTLSAEFKDTLAKKISTDFGLTLPSAAEEEADETGARGRIKDIVARIRATASRAPLVLQRNWEYGFARNLVGDSTISALLSVIGTIAHFATPLGYVFGISTVVYAIILLVSPMLLRRYAGHYARQLLYAFAGDPR